MESHCYGAYSSYPTPITFGPSKSDPPPYSPFNLHDTSTTILPSFDYTNYFLREPQPSPFPLQHDNHQLRLALADLEATLMSTDDDPALVEAPPTTEDPAPHFKFCHMAVLGAIAEACGNDSRIHIVDFRANHGAHWATLLRALAARPGGPPRICFTMIDNDRHDAEGKQLEAISMEFEIPVVFRVMPVLSLDMTRETLGVQPGEALAVNLGPGPWGYDPDGMLRMVKSLGPRVVTAVEDETSMWRFEEVFESAELKDGLDLERDYWARELVDVIDWEKLEAKEVVGRWRWRMEAAGFQKFPVSRYVNSVIRGLLGCYSEDYEVVEEDGAVMLGWKGKSLISASAWH